MISYDFNEYWLFNVSEGGTKQIEIQLLSEWYLFLFDFNFCPPLLNI